MGSGCDWLGVCPPTGTGVKLVADDLLETPLDQAQIDFENEGGENYVCGNPPYVGDKFQTPAQKADLKTIHDGLAAMKALVRQPRGRMAEPAHIYGFSEEDLA